MKNPGARNLFSVQLDRCLTACGFRNNTNQELMVFALFLWIGIFVLLYFLIFAPDFLFSLF